jgi:YfiH family protein
VSLVRDESGLYRSTCLSSLDWLEHAFGTARCNPPGEWRTLYQAHTSRVLNPEEWFPGAVADGMVSDRPGIWVAVKTADCVPILLADLRQPVVAAIHAGWRGTVSGVAATAVRLLTERYGSRSEDLVAALGPSIGPCCFEVGQEVSRLFQKLFPDRYDLHGRSRIDLREANRRVLLSAGLRPEHIDAQPPCTRCGGTEFHSWRRDRRSGVSMYSAIRLR